MRILLLVPHYPPSVGGAELQAQSLARELTSQGAAVTVLTRPCAPAATMDTDRGVRIVRRLSALPLGPLWGLTYMMSTERWTRRLAGSWDVIHNQQVGLHSWPSVRSAQRLGRPCLLRFACSGAGGDLATLGGHRFGQRLLGRLRAAHRFVALTPGGAAELTRYGFPATRIRTIPNGVDLLKFAPQRWPTVAGDGPIRLLFVGRLRYQKGLDVLLDALALLGQPARFHLRVVGDGPELAAWQDRAQRNGLGSLVEFKGTRQDMLAEYAWSEVVVLPSRFEGMPNVVLEAMACARPVLGTRIDGTVDLLAGGGRGWLTPSGDSALLAQRLEEIASQRERLQLMGMQGRAFVEPGFSAAHVASRYLAEYESMVTERSGASA